MFKLFSTFFGDLFLLFLLLNPLFLVVGALLIWKGSGIVRALGWLLILLIVYYRLSWISPWYVIKGSELTQEYKFKDIPFQFITVRSVRWMDSLNRLVVLPSEEVVSNPKSPYYTRLLVVDIEARQSYWLPTAEVNLDATIKLESLRTGYGERRDGLSLYYASLSKQGPRIESGAIGFSLPILGYNRPFPFGETSGWEWGKNYFSWKYKVVREFEAGSVLVKLNQIVFNDDERRYFSFYRGGIAWVMGGKFLIVDVGSRVLVLGPFNTSQDTQSTNNKE